MTRLHLSHHYEHAIDLSYGEQPLFRYVFNDDTDQYESPRPFFAPIHTLGGNLVSIYRPHDHLWHKGISMTLANLSGENFWGGPTYVHGQGYTPLPNNGSMRHDGWSKIECSESQFSAVEELTWITQAGASWLQEVRSLAVPEVDEETGCWMLDYATELTNIHSEALIFGSPTTAGRPMAGYGGLFWRGPRSFSQGGRIWAEGGLEGDEIMGQPAAWLAYSGKHDGSGRRSTLLFMDHPENPRYPTKWFMRNLPFACASFAFIFDEELPLQPGATLGLRYRIAFWDGIPEPAQADRQVATWQQSAGTGA